MCVNAPFLNCGEGGTELSELRVIVSKTMKHSKWFYRKPILKCSRRYSIHKNWFLIQSPVTIE